MTAYQYRAVAANLTRAGWVCTGGMYPDSTAEGNTPVTWVAHFERSAGTGKALERVWLTAATFQSNEIRRAIGMPEEPEQKPAGKDEALSEVIWAGQRCEVLETTPTRIKVRFTNTTGTGACWLDRGANLYRP